MWMEQRAREIAHERELEERYKCRPAHSAGRGMAR